MKIFILFIFSAAFIFPQVKVNVFPNFRIHPSTVTQTELISVFHPLNNNIIFTSANAISFPPPSLFISEGIYVSTNKGADWFGSDTARGANINYHGGDPGIAIDKNGRFILTHLGREPFVGLFSNFSTDNGITWSNNNRIVTDILEKAITVSDGNTASPYFGRTYSFYVSLDSLPPKILFNYSDNGAVTWSTKSRINNPSQRNWGVEAAIDETGKIYLTWGVVNNFSPFKEVYSGFASSTNGGSSWFVKETAFPMNGIQGVLSNKQNIRVNGLPKIAVGEKNGSKIIYIVTTQKEQLPAGNDADIILNYSTDGGNTFSSGIRVNQDDLNNGKTQFFPAVTMDGRNGINVLYYDDRTTTNDSASVYLSRSTDYGLTWRDFKISNHNFKPTPIGGLGQGYQGDNISIISSGDSLFAFWMDNSTGIYQAWCSIISLDALTDVKEEKIIAVNFEVIGNYPNPFNPSTKIRIYNNTLSNEVKIKIYNSLGKIISSNIYNLSYGYNDLEFDGSNLNSGVYYYQIISGDKIFNNKMMLIK
ncbi:MAG TPA: T9SS type A sorting domain-containing protein [Ignavibacteriaceae bacterium]|nr:T9SS type A sorting domain-containing protein [Ignavibacteriaceae bacterium]